MKKVAFCILVLIFAISLGCAKKVVQKEWIAAGGSRADGTVKMMISYNPQFEKIDASERQAKDLASRKCQAWGYDYAEPFGGVLTNCQRQDFWQWHGMVCVDMALIAEFQCIGRPHSDGKISPTSKQIKSK